MKNLNLHKYPQVYNCICYLQVHIDMKILKGGGGGEEIFIRIVTRMEDRRLWMHLTLEIRCSGEQPAAFLFTATIRGLLLPGIFFLSTRAFCHGYLERAKLRDFDRQVYLEFIGA